MTSTNTRVGRASVANPTDATDARPTRNRRGPDQAQQRPRVGRVGRVGHFTPLTVPPSPLTERDRKDSNVKPTADPLLTVAEVAEQLGTTERFPRRLIAERRITFVKLGAGRSGHVRIPQSALDAYIAESTVRASE
jgi:excisionase family DNA binding protein